MGPHTDSELQRHVVEVGLASQEDVEATKRGLEDGSESLSTEAVVDEMAKGGVISAEQAKRVKDKVESSRGDADDSSRRSTSSSSSDQGSDGSGSGREVQAVCPICGHRAMVRADDALAECPQTGCAGRMKYMEETIKREPADAAAMKGIQGRLGFYELQKRLGYGGFSLVYAATIQDDKTGRDYRRAIKLLHQHLVMNEREVSLFFDEVGSLQQVLHPSMVRVYESGTTPDGRPFIVMDFVEGRSLRQAMEELSGRMDVGTALGIVAQVAGALHEAHRVGLIHRDIKPGNIMVRYEDDPAKVQAVLLDFGIAKFVDGMTDGRLTYSGTKAYQAPEQLAGRPEMASDVYAMGVLLYQLLSGRLPHQNPSGRPTSRRGSAGQALRKIYPLGRLSNVPPSIQTQLDRLLRRCLAAKIDARPSAEELASELVRVRARVLAGETAPARSRPRLWPWVAAASLVCAAGLTLSLPQTRAALAKVFGGAGDKAVMTRDPIAAKLEERAKQVTESLGAGSFAEAQRRLTSFADQYGEVLLPDQKDSVARLQDTIAAAIGREVTSRTGPSGWLKEFAAVVEVLAPLPDSHLEQAAGGVGEKLASAVKSSIAAGRFDEADHAVRDALTEEQQRVIEKAGLASLRKELGSALQRGKDDFVGSVKKWVPEASSDWAQAKSDLLAFYRERVDRGSFTKAQEILDHFAESLPQWDGLDAEKLRSAQRAFNDTRDRVAGALSAASDEAGLRQALGEWAGLRTTYSENAEATGLASTTIGGRVDADCEAVEAMLDTVRKPEDLPTCRQARDVLKRVVLRLDALGAADSETKMLTESISTNREKVGASEARLFGAFARQAAAVDGFDEQWVLVWNEFFERHHASPHLGKAWNASLDAFDGWLKKHYYEPAQQGSAKTKGSEQQEDKLAEARKKLGAAKQRFIDAYDSLAGRVTEASALLGDRDALLARLEQQDKQVAKSQVAGVTKPTEDVPPAESSEPGEKRPDVGKAVTVETPRTASVSGKSTATGGKAEGETPESKVVEKRPEEGREIADPL